MQLIALIVKTMSSLSNLDYRAFFIESFLTKTRQLYVWKPTFLILIFTYFIYKLMKFGRVLDSINPKVKTTFWDLTQVSSVFRLIQSFFTLFSS